MSFASKKCFFLILPSFQPSASDARRIWYDCGAFLGVNYAIISVSLIKIIWGIYVKASHSILHFSATKYTIATLCLHYTLSFGRYVQNKLCLYTRSNAYHTDLFYSTGYDNPDAIRNCNKMMFSLDNALRQQTFKHFLLDRTVTQTRHFDDVYDQFRSSKDPTLSLSSIPHTPNVFWSKSLRLDVRETSGLQICERVIHCFLRCSPLSSLCFCLVPTLSDLQISENEVFESCREHPIRFYLWVIYYQNAKLMNTPKLRSVLVLCQDRKDNSLIAILIVCYVFLFTRFNGGRCTSLCKQVIVVYLLSE